MLDIKNAKRKWYNQLKSCENRIDKHGNKIEMKLTFDQWFDIWQKSGKWYQRGRRVGQYVMARKNDIGHYELNNVTIEPVSNNCAERNKNTKPYNRNGENNPAYGRILPKVRCSYCNKIVDIANLARWHKHKDQA